MTIAKILQALSEKIDPNIELTNIATVNDGDEFIQVKSSILLSIVNIEEDKTLKNQNLYKVPNGNTVDRYKNPAQNLILSLLFTSYIKNQDIYSDGLEKLERIIRYLQNNNVFYYDDTQLYDEPTEVQKKSLNKIILDLVSLKSDQLNQMWSYLGSKYMPSVLYTMRMIYIQNQNNLPTEKIINKAKVQLWSNDINDKTGELEAISFDLD